MSLSIRSRTLPLGEAEFDATDLADGIDKSPDRIGSLVQNILHAERELHSRGVSCARKCTPQKRCCMIHQYHRNKLSGLSACWAAEGKKIS